MLRAWKLRTPSHVVVCLGALLKASMLKLSGSDFSSQWFMGYPSCSAAVPIPSPGNPSGGPRVRQNSLQSADNQTRIRPSADPASGGGGGETPALGHRIRRPYPI